MEENKQFSQGQIFAGFVVFILVVWFCASSDAKKESAKHNGDTSEATVAIHEFVKDRLKSPSSADFPWGDSSATREIGYGEFKLSSYVDAENSFGASLRTHYSATVKKQAGRWVLTNINIR